MYFKTAGQASVGGKTARYYGDIYYPSLGMTIDFKFQFYKSHCLLNKIYWLILENNIVNELVENGLVTVKTVKSNNPTPDVQTLMDLQNKAKNAKVGKWDPNAKVIFF